MTKKKDESILVVKRSLLFGDHTWQGLMTSNLMHYTDAIKQHQEFHPRSLMEEDSSYKQIIPYLVFNYDNRYFLMQRRSTASEKRLASQFSLGIGGHIRKEDVENKSIIDWAQREFHEEVSYEGQYTSQLVGILNDDSNAVGQVHLGLVFLLTGNSEKIYVKSELKSGALLSLPECDFHYESLETWSQIVFSHLICQSRNYVIP